MSAVRDVARLDAEDWARVDALLADWQILADLSFGDLVLWVPDRHTDSFWVAAHIRPTTGPTAITSDVVGGRSAAADIPLVASAFHKGRIATQDDGVVVADQAIPVRRGDRVLAVIARHRSGRPERSASPLERAYLLAAGDLANMVASGAATGTGVGGLHADSPRVGDGFIRLEASGIVDYASPNAQSVFRKLGLTGDLVGADLVEVTRDLVPSERRADEELLSALLAGRRAGEIEVGNESATVVVRVMPLASSESRGGLVLVRDVTDLRRRDRELITKDATIREIHHRVKNNLQTVAALLRLQMRRLDNPEGRAALEEAVRRVAAIAVVHDTLSQSFDETVAFDEVADQLARLISDVGGHGDAVLIRREGSFGTLSSDVATPLALVLTELVQNAVEHGYPGDDGGQILVRCRRPEGSLRVEVSDDGVGLPTDFDIDRSASLGLSIVRTLVDEMGGTLRAYARVDGGTCVEVAIP